MLDWLKVRRENAFRCEARYAAGTATITNYDGAGPAAELHSYMTSLAMARVVAYGSVLETIRARL